VRRSLIFLKDTLTVFLHSKVQLCQRIEGLLVASLEEIDRLQFYSSLGYASLFTYAVTALRLSEATAYGFITVARKSREIPELKQGILNQKLTVSKAVRIVGSLSVENAAELIHFASTHSTRETDRKVAALRVSAEVGKNLVALKISRKTKDLLRRARELLASKKISHLDLDQALQFVLEDYLQRHEPMKKAQRAVARRHNHRANSVRTEFAAQAEGGVLADGKPLVSSSVRTECAMQTKYSVRAELMPNRRPRLLAHEKHEVFARDGGRCTFKDALGRRCESERWLHIHQLSLPIEGQVSWLKEPERAYLN
jgi:hypothetical protein